MTGKAFVFWTGCIVGIIVCAVVGLTEENETAKKSVALPGCPPGPGSKGSGDGPGVETA